MLKQRRMGKGTGAHRKDMSKGQNSKKGDEKNLFLDIIFYRVFGETRNQDPREHANSKYRIN